MMKLFVSFLTVFTLIAGVLCFVAYLNFVQVNEDFTEQKVSEPMPEALGSFNPNRGTLLVALENHNRVTESGVNAGGYAKGPGIAIEWEGTYTPTDAKPIHVLKLVAERMSFLQQSPEANNDQAKALLSVMEAVDYLDRTTKVTSPVGPGLPPSLGAAKDE